MTAIKLVVGLGNPGPKYRENRHNIGQLALSHLPFFDQLDWQKKFKGFFAQRDFNSERVYFLLPQTYMNLSGESVLALAQFFKILPPEILVIHDELDLPYGKIVFKKGGGLAGHNGLKSMASMLSSQDFLRMRLGISRPTHGEVKDWVLEDFDKIERQTLEQYLKAASSAVVMSLVEGFEKASATFGQKNWALPA